MQGDDGGAASADSATPKPIGKRIHALKQFASGPAAEIAVTAALLRSGLAVARPYWLHDHVDLLVFWDVRQRLVPITVQVKALQFKTERSEPYKVRTADGIKRRYLDDSSLCLAIYRPDTDAIWFYAGPDEILSAYEVAKSAEAPQKGAIPPEDDVAFRLKATPGKEYDARWRWPKDDASWISRRVQTWLNGWHAKKRILLCCLRCGSPTAKIRATDRRKRVDGAGPLDRRSER